MRISEVENCLEELIKILKSKIDDLKEVRIYGSYNNGNFNPQTSDIDLAVILNRNFLGEVPSSKEILQILSEKFPYLQNKFDVYFLTPSALESLTGYNMGGGDLGQNISEGRLLYSSSFWWRLFNKSK